MHKWAPTHGIYFIPRFCLQNPAPGTADRPPKPRPFRPYTGIWLRALSNLDVNFFANLTNPKGGIPSRAHNSLEICQDLVCWTRHFQAIAWNPYFVTCDSTEIVTYLKSSQNFRGKTHNLGWAAQKLKLAHPDNYFPGFLTKNIKNYKPSKLFLFTSLCSLLHK